MFRFLPLALLAALATTVPAQAPTLDAAATVATVNGEPIKAGEFYHRLEWFRPNLKDPLAPLPVGFQVLRQMIDERIVLQLAKSKGVAPSVPQVDARFADIVKATPNLKDQLAESGRSEGDIRAELANEEAQFNVLTAGVTITDLEVEKRYKELPSQFEEPARFKLRVIAVGDDAAQGQVDDALKAGKPFPDVAKQYSADERTRASGGDYGMVTDTGLPAALHAAIATVPAGGTSAWLKTDQGARLKFLVESSTPSRLLPLDAGLKARIRRGMMLERGRSKNSATKDIQAATLAANVTIAQPGFQRLYNEMVARMRQAG